MPAGSVPYNAADVTPTAGVPDAQIRSQANPQDFGSQVGEATQRAGEQGQDQAVKYLQMATEAKAENTIANQFVPAAAQLKADYMQNKGIDAVKAQPAYLASVQNLRNQFIGKSNSPYETQILSSYMSRHAAQETDFSSMYAEQQQTDYENQTHQAMQDTYSTSAAMNYNNPTIIDQNIKSSDALTLKRGLDLGQDPQSTIPDIQSKNRGAIVGNTIDAAVANNDMPAAMNVYNTYKGSLDPKDLRQIEAYLGPKMSDYDSRAITEHVLGQATQKYNDVAYGANQGAANSGMNLPGANIPIPGLGGLTGAQIPPVSPQDLGQGQPSAHGNAPIAASAIDTNGKAIPSMGDYYKANYDSIISDARDQAAKTHPDDIAFIEKTEARTKQHMDATIKAEAAQNSVDVSTVLRGLNGDFTKGVPPSTIDDLVNSSPDVKNAWNSMQQNNPAKVHDIETQMVGKDTVNNSPNGYDAIKSVADNAKDQSVSPEKMESYLHQKIGRKDGTGYNLKDYNDAKPLLDASQSWGKFISENMDNISKANGNVDGQGQQRAVNWYNYVTAQKKANDTKGDKALPEDQMIKQLRDVSGPHMPSRMQQISNWASRIVHGNPQQQETAPVQAATPNVPPAAAIAYLRANPNLASDFDAQFGAGSSKTILGK